MVTVSYPASSLTRPLLWLKSLLREELAPFPERGPLVARMVFAAGLVMVINMTFQVPFGAYGAIYGLILSREHPQVTLQAAKTMFVSLSFAGAYVLVGAVIFSGDPVLRLVWVLFTLFLMFWGLKAVSNYTAAARFGYLLVITIPLWDRAITAEQKVVQTLWAVWAISFASGITAAVELIYHRLRPSDPITSSLVERLQCVARLLRCWSMPAQRPTIERQMMRFAMLGTSHMRLDLLRSGYSADFNEQFGAVIALVGRLVDLADNLRHFSDELSSADARRIQALVSSIEVLSDDIFRQRVPQASLIPPGANYLTAHVPILIEMETTVSLIGETLSRSDSPTGYYPPPKRQQPAWRFFVPDAFSNPDYVRFAIRGGLAASACYLTYSLIDWPGISTAVTTCLLTALTTIGASRQMQILRFGGAVFGGVILGFGAQIFILPNVDSFAGFLVLFIAVSLLAAWIATSGPRLSYFGVQVAVAFYLINLQEFKFQTSLAIARDRVAGIMLGLIAMWLIFDQLWGAPAIREMQRTFIQTTRLLAEFLRAPISLEPDAAVEETHQIRDKIGANFESLRQHADGVMLEFGATRAQDLALRATLIRWQLRLRELFRLRIALLKYRLHLPGFEIPLSAQLTQRAIDEEIARRLDAVADRMAGKVGLTSDETTSDAEVMETRTELTSWDIESASPSMQTFIPLLKRLESVAATLEHEISRSCVNDGSSEAQWNPTLQSAGAD